MVFALAGDSTTTMFMNSNKLVGPACRRSRRIGAPLSRRKMGLSTLPVKRAAGDGRRANARNRGWMGRRLALFCDHFMKQDKKFVGSRRDYASTRSRWSSGAINDSHAQRCLPAQPQTLPERHGSTILVCGSPGAAIPPRCAPRVPSWNLLRRSRAGGFSHVDHHVHRRDGIAAGNGARAGLGAGQNRRRSSAALRRHLNSSSFPVAAKLLATLGPE